LSDDGQSDKPEEETAYDVEMVDAIERLMNTCGSTSR
jgi:hypothetical protein